MMLANIKRIKPSRNFWILDLPVPSICVALIVVQSKILQEFKSFCKNQRGKQRFYTINNMFMRINPDTKMLQLIFIIAKLSQKVTNYVQVDEKTV